jgi:hypothetical protein
MQRGSRSRPGSRLFSADYDALVGGVSNFIDLEERQ